MRHVIVILLLSVLSSCATISGFFEDKEQQEYLTGVEQERLTITKELRRDLLELVSSIEYSSRILAETKNAESALNMTRDEMAQLEWNVSQVPDGMGIPMTMDQVGHPEPMIKMIAQLTGYIYMPIGTPPKDILPVRITQSTTAHQILYSISKQMGSAVLVEPVPNTRTLYVNWQYGRQQL